MEILFLILGLAWAGYLAQVVLRRRAARPSAIGDYRRTLSRLAGVRGDDVVMSPALGRSSSGFGPSRSVTAARARRARKRRRDVFLGLTATAVGTFVVGLLPGFRVMLAVSMVMIVALGLFAMALVRMRMPAHARAGASGFAPAYAYAYAGDGPSDDYDGDRRYDSRYDSRYESRYDARYESRYDARSDRYESADRYRSDRPVYQSAYQSDAGMRARRDVEAFSDWD
jgi:hypothetical protein